MAEPGGSTAINGFLYQILANLHYISEIQLSATLDLTFRTLTCSIYIFFEIAKKQNRIGQLLSHTYLLLLKLTPCFPSGCVSDSQKHKRRAHGAVSDLSIHVLQTRESLHKSFRQRTHPLIQASRWLFYPGRG